MKNVKVVLVLTFLVSLFFLSTDVMASHRHSMSDVDKGVKSETLAKNVCNPCSVKNPCSAKQPCQPCSPKAQPCGTGKKVTGEFMRVKDAIAYGKKIWKDPSLGKSGLSCSSCHQGGKSFKKTATKPYPHYVGMPNRVVTLDQMINFCMIVPMKSSPLAWDSKEMTALSAYLQNVVLKEAKAKLGQPCGMMQPCGMKQPCSMKQPCNPCDMKNPCSMKQPCNPCSMKNPCGM